MKHLLAILAFFIPALALGQTQVISINLTTGNVTNLGPINMANKQLGVNGSLFDDSAKTTGYVWFFNGTSGNYELEAGGSGGNGSWGSPGITGNFTTQVFPGIANSVLLGVNATNHGVGVAYNATTINTNLAATYQPLNANLTSLATVTPNLTTVQTNLAATYQPLNANLTSLATVSANLTTVVTNLAATYQPLNANLTSLAGVASNLSTVVADLTIYAPLASPHLTGTPLSPNLSWADNTDIVNNHMMGNYAQPINSNLSTVAGGGANGTFLNFSDTGVLNFGTMLSVSNTSTGAWAGLGLNNTLTANATNTPETPGLQLKSQIWNGTASVESDYIFQGMNGVGFAGIKLYHQTALSSFYTNMLTISDAGNLTVGNLTPTNALATTYGGMKPGGTTNQVLAKNSNSDYDLKWATAGTGTVQNLDPGGTGFTTTGNGTATVTLSGQLNVANISATGTPSAVTYLRGDGTWTTPAGAVSSVTGTSNEITASPTTGTVVLTTPGTYSGGNTVLWTTALASGNYTLPAINSSLAYNYLTAYGNVSPTLNNYDVTASFSGYSGAKLTTMPTTASYATGGTLTILDAAGGASASNYVNFNWTGTETLSGRATSVQNITPYAFTSMLNTGSGWIVTGAGVLSQNRTGWGQSVQVSNNSTVFGGQAVATSINGTVMGFNAAIATGVTDSMAMGISATVDAKSGTTGLDGMALGPWSEAHSWRAVAIGPGAAAWSVSSEAFGVYSFAYGTHAFSIGPRSHAMYSNTMAFGRPNTPDVYFQSGEASITYDGLNRLPGPNGLVNSTASATTLHGVDGSDWSALVFFTDNSTVPAGGGGWGYLTINGTGVPTAVVVLQGGSGYTAGNIVANYLCVNTGAPTLGYTLSTGVITSITTSGGTGFNPTTNNLAGGNLNIAAGTSTGSATGGSVNLQVANGTAGSSNTKNNLVTGLSVSPVNSTASLVAITGNLSVSGNANGTWNGTVSNAIFAGTQTGNTTFSGCITNSNATVLFTGVGNSGFLTLNGTGKMISTAYGSGNTIFGTYNGVPTAFAGANLAFNATTITASGGGGGSSAWSNTSTTIYANISGNTAPFVGIGNTTPTDSLDVTGTVAATQISTASNTSTYTVKAGSLLLQSYTLGNAWVGENIYYNGSIFRYDQTGYGALLYFYQSGSGYSGQFRLYPSGTAGTTVPNDNICQMQINLDGSFGVGPSVSTNPGFLSSSANFYISPSGDATITGNIAVNTAGDGLKIQSGSNAKAGTVTLSSGAATVSTTAITANSTVSFGLKTKSGTLTQAPYMSAVTAGTSFNVTASATDNSTYNWVIIDLQ